MSPMIRLAADLSAQVRREPFFLGYYLAEMRQEYAWSFEEQAAVFGLDMEALARLALCRMPATVEDLERIAAYVGMEPAGLGELLQLDLVP